MNNLKKIKIGVFGANRGRTMIDYCESCNDAVLVAVCDSSEFSLNRVKKDLNDDSITYYSSFEDFLNHDMDAVVLANYATEHAPFAIRCLKSGLNVISEVLPCQTLKEAAELCDAAEESGLVYAYSENYCYMPAPYEMKKLIRSGKLGKFEYAEGEYMHNCEPIWQRCTYGDESHWRNNMYASFYCTHSIGPLIHISGQRPVSVTGFELPFNDRMKRMGAKAGFAAVEMITLESGAIIKSLHGVGCSKNSVWYSVYGSEGRAESAREDAENGGVKKIYVNTEEIEVYEPKDSNSLEAKHFDHGGSDFYTMHNFIEKLRGNKNADIIDVYEALDMFLPGLLAYRSVLGGGIPMEIPNFRDKKVRDKFRNDTACTSPKVAGDMLIPSYSKGNPEIPEETYISIKESWNKMIEPKKQKLKMYIFPKKKTIGALPDGYTIRTYRDKNDIMPWVETCKNGLLSDDADEGAFEGRILEKDGITPENDLFFIEHDGKIVATITAVDNFDGENIGCIHMVSVSSEERGHSLGKVLCDIAERKLFDDNVHIAYLVTDDWRKGACKTYLKAGYYPVNYDDDMEERWSQLLKEFGLTSVMMVTDSGEPDKMIYAAE